MFKNPLTHIFTDQDKVFSTNLDSTGGHYQQQILTSSDTTGRSYFCINPISGQRRLKTTISNYRNFLFESDNMPLLDQYKLAEDLRQSGLVSMATYSGSKSIHFIISAADTLKFGEPGSEDANDRYRRTWLGLERLLREFGMTSIDQTNKNPVTLSRMPGHMRGEVEQTLLYTGPLQTAEFLQSLTVETKQNNIVPTSKVHNFEELEQALEAPKHAKLKLALQYPANFLNTNNGNYPLLFRYAAWLIDETNAPLESALKYFKKYFVPHLEAKSYFKDWQKPIVDAYRHKGVL